MNYNKVSFAKVGLLNLITQMKELKIINESYYKSLILIISTLLIYNIYSTIISKNLIGVLPIILQSVLIYLLLTKNKLAQNVIKIWTIIVFFIAQGLRIIGMGMQTLGKNMQGEENATEILSTEKILLAAILIIIGIIIWNLNKGFGEIIRTSKFE